MGIFLEKTLPIGFFNPGNISLILGPFTVKEHVLIYVIAGSAGGLPWVISILLTLRALVQMFLIRDNVVVQYAKPYMDDTRINFWNSIAWVAVSQLVGYGVAGITRRFLVKPPSMLWPTGIFLF
jgi:hypothetical protein